MRIAAFAAWFAAVYAAALLWFFPVDALVEAQTQTVEARSGLRLRWKNEHWALWRSRIDDVTVADARGHVWLRLSSLELRTGIDGIHIQGTAPWGGLNGTVRLDGVEVDLDGYPLPAMESKALEEGRLRAHLVLLQAKSSAHGTFNISGRGRLLVYEGPVSISGTFEAHPTEGQASVELLGDRLRGHGELTFNVAGGDWSKAQVSGPLRVEQRGATLTLAVGGPLDNLTIKTQ